MDILHPLASIAFAGLIHASFQLSISTLTLLSSHAIGIKATRRRLLKLVGGFSVGAVLMTLLIISSTVLWLQMVLGVFIPPLIWATACGFLIGLSIAVWFFYYRKEPGTSLWVPRGLARYLVDRTKKTKVTAEAFGLGMTSVIAELLFIAGPVIIAALFLIQLAPFWQVIGITLYALTSLSPFLFVAGCVASGYNIGKIQRWRETNKGFLQFIAGLGLFVLAVCVYVTQVSQSAAFIDGGY